MNNRLIWILLFLVWAATAASGQEKLEVLRHNHLALHVRDIAKSATFYREVLGLTPIAVPPDLQAIRAWFQVGADQQIHLLAGRRKRVHHDRNGSHFALFVRSIEAAEAFLKARSLPYHRQVRFDGVVQLYFADPDGYLIELNAAPN